MARHSPEHPSSSHEVLCVTREGALGPRQEALQGSHQGPLTDPSSSCHSGGRGSHVGPLTHPLAPAKVFCLRACCQGTFPSRWQGLNSKQCPRAIRSSGNLLLWITLLCSAHVGFTSCTGDEDMSWTTLEIGPSLSGQRPAPAFSFSFTSLMISTLLFHPSYSLQCLYHSYCCSDAALKHPPSRNTNVQVTGKEEGGQRKGNVQLQKKSPFCLLYLSVDEIKRRKKFRSATTLRITES